MLAILGGSTSLAAGLAAYREWFGPFQSLLFLVALILIGRAHDLYWTRLRRNARPITRASLWISTTLTLVMVGLFYVYGNLWSF